MRIDINHPGDASVADVIRQVTQRVEAVAMATQTGLLDAGLCNSAIAWATYGNPGAWVVDPINFRSLVKTPPAELVKRIASPDLVAVTIMGAGSIGSTNDPDENKQAVFCVTRNGIGDHSMSVREWSPDGPVGNWKDAPQRSDLDVLIESIFSCVAIGIDHLQRAARGGVNLRFGTLPRE